MTNRYTARRAAAAELDAARDVWRNANIARGKIPDAARVRRVEQKLVAAEVIVVVALDKNKIVGMALAEPGRAEDGNGPEIPGLCHISMVFVDPDYWGKRVGEILLSEVATRAERQTLRLWTGISNERAQRLYRRAGFVPSGRTVEHAGEPIIQLERSVRIPPRVGPSDEQPRQAADERRAEHHHDPDQLHPG